MHFIVLNLFCRRFSEEFRDFAMCHPEYAVLFNSSYKKDSTETAESASITADQEHVEHEAIA